MNIPSSAIDSLPKTPSFRLDGKRALVTGAGRGIGLALAAALADSGAVVSLAARSLPELNAAVEAIKSRGGRAEALALDVTDRASCAAVLGAAGSYEILINNAGTNRPKSFVDVTVEDYDVIMNLNVRAVFFVAQTIARGMIEAGRGGIIINVSSQMGHVGASNRTVYCASKHALEGLTKAMAIELAPYKIRVNTLAPTFIETPMTQPFFEKAEFRNAVLEKVKLGRIGQVEDLMGAIQFLSSDASALMTGTSLILDGGWTAD